MCSPIRLTFLSLLSFTSLLVAQSFVDVTQTSQPSNGNSWATAYTCLFDALESNNGEDIHIAAGVYYVPFGEDAFLIEKSVRLIGGFPSGGASEPDFRSNLVILSGDIDRDDSSQIALSLSDIQGKNSPSVIRTIDDGITVSIEGLTITAGDGRETSGGGISASEVILHLTDCTLIGNRTTGSSNVSGGGIDIPNGELQLTRCSFLGNFSEGSGGAVSAEGSTAIAENCLFMGNAATTGGALSLDQKSHIFTHCTFSGNAATTSGGAISGTQQTPVTFVNSIVWNNSAGGSNSNASSSTDLPSSDVVIESSTVAGASGTVPLFIFPADPAAAPAAIGNLQLSPSSPAIGAGDNSKATTGPDLLGSFRIGGVKVDQGCYEIVTEIYVDLSATGANNGSNWEDAFVSLQDALAATTGASSTILVAEGSYFPDVGQNVTNNLLTETFSLDDIRLVGGYPAGGGLQGTQTTILSGDIEGNDITSNGVTVSTSDILGNNSPFILTLLGDAVIDSFTVTAAKANPELLNDSAAIRSLQSGYIEMLNCTVIGNIGDDTLQHPGCAVSIRGEVSVLGCHFENNTNDPDSFTACPGLGITTTDSNILVEDTTFVAMVTPNGGSPNGIGCRIAGPSSITPTGTAIVRNCSFSENQFIGGNTLAASLSLQFLSEARVEFCEFSNNLTPRTISFGAVGNAIVNNCLAFNNLAFTTIGLSRVDSLEIINSTLLGPSPSTLIGIFTGNDAILTPLSIKNSLLSFSIGVESRVPLLPVSYENCLSLGETLSGSTNLPGDTDPGFVGPIFAGSPLNRDGVRLASGSPLVDQGNNSFVTVTEDLLGGTRIRNGLLGGTNRVDIGAIEYDGPAFTTDLPEITICNIARDPVTLDITLTVESTAVLPIAIVAGISPDNLFPLAQDFDLTIGTNTIQIPSNLFPSTQEKFFFRIVEANEEGAQ